jgi:hypothetical protein
MYGLAGCKPAERQTKCMRYGAEALPLKGQVGWGLISRRLMASHWMLGEEPNLDLVGAEHLTDKQIVGPVIFEFGRTTNAGPGRLEAKGASGRFNQEFEQSPSLG